jgi:REP element-mobilizing transposase RayT
MVFDPDRHHRRSIRLRGYDYSRAGAYFVTICVQDRTRLFGEIADGSMHLNDAGRTVRAVWEEIPAFYPGVGIDHFIVMPDHFHGIIVLLSTIIVGAVGAGPRACPNLPDVIRRFKTKKTKRYYDGVKGSGLPAIRGRLWQRNYYERIVRNQRALDRIRQYIDQNPQRAKS